MVCNSYVTIRNVFAIIFTSLSLLEEAPYVFTSFSFFHFFFLVLQAVPYVVFQ